MLVVVFRIRNKGNRPLALYAGIQNIYYQHDKNNLKTLKILYRLIETFIISTLAGIAVYFAGWLK